jgi:hypothetical protein
VYAAARETGFVERLDAFDQQIFGKSLAQAITGGALASSTGQLLVPLSGGSAIVALDLAGNL